MKKNKKYKFLKKKEKFNIKKKHLNMAKNIWKNEISVENVGAEIW